MTEEEAIRLHSIAFKYAIKNGLAEYAEDYAQQFVLMKLCGWHNSMYHAKVDFMRKQFGDKRNLKGIAQADARHTPWHLIEGDSHA